MSKAHDRYLVLDLDGGTLPVIAIGTYPTIDAAKKAAEERIADFHKDADGEATGIIGGWFETELEGGLAIQYSLDHSAEIRPDEMIIVPVPIMEPYNRQAQKRDKEKVIPMTEGRLTSYESLNHRKLCFEGDIARLHQALGSVETPTKVNEVQRELDAARYSLEGLEMAADHRPELVPNIVDFLESMIAICEHNSWLYKSPHRMANPIPSMKAFIKFITQK